MLLAAAALTCVKFNKLTMSFKLPAPPNAIKGIEYLEDSFEIKSISYPFLVPSLLIKLIINSPMPSCSRLSIKFIISILIFFLEL